MTIATPQPITALRTVQSISDSTQGIVDVLGRLQGGSFWDQLQPASFRGVPFFVLDVTARAGRRNALHEYPGRDVPWVEDLGMQARRYQFTGFLVGDDVIAQRGLMRQAAEKPGDGELVLASYGRGQVALMSLEMIEHRDRGRYVELRFDVVKQGLRLYPQASTSGTDAVSSAAAATNASSVTSFVSKVLGVLKNGAAVLNQAAQQASAYAGRAIEVVQDATSLVKLAVSLPGDFGRLIGLASGVDPGEVLPVVNGLTVAGLTGLAAASRDAVSIAAESLVAAGNAISTVSPDPVATAAQALADAVLTASSTPGDGIRALGKLAAFTPVGLASGDELVIQGACSDTFRRAAVTAMARAATSYQPATADDAVAIRDLVVAALDAEITIAGDQGEDAVFGNLRALRAQVVMDLNERGAQLPSLVDVTLELPIPSLVAAQLLYRDPTRADELVRRSDCVHPAFMPTSFRALNQ